METVLRIAKGVVEIPSMALAVQCLQDPIGEDFLLREISGWEMANEIPFLGTYHESAWWAERRAAFFRHLEGTARFVESFSAYRSLLASASVVRIDGPAKEAEWLADALEILSPEIKCSVHLAQPGTSRRMFRAVRRARKTIALKRLSLANETASKRGKIGIIQYETRNPMRYDQDTGSVEKSLRRRGADFIIISSPSTDWKANAWGLLRRNRRTIFAEAFDDWDSAKIFRKKITIREKIFVFNGNDYGKFIARFFSYWYTKPYLSNLLTTWRKTLTACRLESLITSRENRLLGCPLSAARDLGIKTYSVQHGKISQSHPLYILPKISVTKLALPDTFFVYSVAELNLLTTKSVYKASQIRSVGSVQWDEMPLQKKEDNTDEFQNILFTCQPFLTTQHWAHLHDQLLTVQKKVILRIRPHPREPSQKLALTKYIGNVKVLRAGNKKSIGHELSKCDAHVTWNSTCATHAVYLNKPTLFIGEMKDDWRDELCKEGVAFRVRDFSNLGTALNYIESHEIRSKIIAAISAYKHKFGWSAAGAGEAIAHHALQDQAPLQTERSRSENEKIDGAL